MKVNWKLLVLAAALGLGSSWVVLRAAVRVEGPVAAEESACTPAPDSAAGENLPDTTVVVLCDGKAQNQLLEEYITGVVLGEMPAEFETEALKAQAVVARTYTLRRVEGKSVHEEAHVCTDSGCCQAYCDPGTYLALGNSRESLEKVRSAVYATAGEVLLYNGALIDATYFSCSGGRTEDALAVWGTDIPYLQAAESPGEEHAAHYTDTVFMTREEFIACVDTRLPADMDLWIGETILTEGGGVETIRIGQRLYTGTQVRTMLALRSTAFTMTVKNGGVEIVTRGFGHRVGMSQYGADAMAASGSTYPQILAHYYQGTVLADYR